MSFRFAAGLWRFLQTPLAPDVCGRIIAESLQSREQNFLRLLRRAVYDFPRSPHLALLRWAGVEYGDVEKMVRTSGIEDSMERLFEAGVHVNLDEFKGRRPNARPGLALEFVAEDFDNPLLASEFEVESGGSTGPRRRMKIDFDLLLHDAPCFFATFDAAGAAASRCPSGEESYRIRQASNTVLSRRNSASRWSDGFPRFGSPGAAAAFGR